MWVSGSDVRSIMQPDGVHKHQRLRLLAEQQGDFQLRATNRAKTITHCEARANSTAAKVHAVTQRSHLVRANLS